MVNSGNPGSPYQYGDAAPGFRWRSTRATREHRTEVCRSLVAVDALAAFVALLRFDRQGRDGSCLKALDRDWLAGLLAEPVRTVLDARQRLVDLCDQFALAVTSAQLDR